MWRPESSCSNHFYRLQPTTAADVSVPCAASVRQWREELSASQQFFAHPKTQIRRVDSGVGGIKKNTSVKTDASPPETEFDELFLGRQNHSQKKTKHTWKQFSSFILDLFFVNFLCIAYTDRLESGFFLKNLKKCFATCLIFSNTRSVLSLPESTSSSCWTQLFCKKCLCIWSGIWENRVNTNLFLV